MRKSDNILFCSLETDDKVLDKSYCIKSANHFDIDLKVFGLGTKWESFFTKIEILNKELNRLKGEYDLVLFVDLRDTMFWADKETIVKRLEEINYFGQFNLVFNSETDCFPYEPFREPMLSLEKDNKYSFLNSGMFIGEIDFVSYCLNQINDIYADKPSIISEYEKECLKNKKSLNKGIVWDDDQFHWQSMYLNSPNQISIDAHNQLFQIVFERGGGETANFDLIINEDYIYNQHTKTYPLLFHSPGTTSHLSQFEKLLDTK